MWVLNHIAHLLHTTRWDHRLIEKIVSPLELCFSYKQKSWNGRFVPIGDKNESMNWAEIIWLELGFSQFSTSSNRFLLVRTFMEQGVQMTVINKCQWCGANTPGALCRLWLEVPAAVYIWVPWKTALLLMRTKGQSRNCVHVVWPMFFFFPILCSLSWLLGGLDLHTDTSCLYFSPVLDHW